MSREDAFGRLAGRIIDALELADEGGPRFRLCPECREEWDDDE